MKSIIKIAKMLKEEPGALFDSLENLSMFEVEGAFVLSYFVRSNSTGKTLILRGSVLPEGQDDEVETLSVQSIWPMVEMYEREISDLFGVVFKGAPVSKRVLLPEDWDGYPLRKSYVFPSQFLGILHMRPVGQTDPDGSGSES